MMRPADSSLMGQRRETARPTIADLVRRFGGTAFPLSRRAMLGSARTRPAGTDLLELDDPRLATRPRDLRIHSGTIEPGDAFAALPGMRADGARFIPDAVARGAGLILLPPERSLDAVRSRVRSQSDAVLWLHPRAAEIAGHVASAIHDAPSRNLQVAGVTGTNGKTSVCHIASQIFSASLRSPAILGTAGHVLRGPNGPLRLEARNTTPDATDVHRLLARHRAEGGDSALMEVSSHGLELGRLAGVQLGVGAFTNLTREHLDFHGTMARYLRAKARLWDHVAPDGAAVVFGTSDASHGMARAARDRGLRVVSVTVDSGHLPTGTDELTGRIVQFDARGAVLDIDGLGLEARGLRLPLRGAHNVENALVSAAIARSMGVGRENVLHALGRVVAAPGRLEPVEFPMARNAAFDVFVDYAHSPDALERVLGALRQDLHSASAAKGSGERPGRLICVFGCGGDRDTGKRGPMGSAVGRLADVAIVTSDNPRSEDPAAIANAVVRGVDMEGGRRLVELDRRTAIERAVSMARPGDVVLIAGKGHENTQVIGTGTVPFDDRVVATEALAAYAAASVAAGGAQGDAAPGSLDPSARNAPGGPR